MCRASEVRRFASVRGRDYWRCEVCEATFLDPAQRPSRVEERAEYVRHQNEVDDPRYRAFLSKLAEPLMARVEAASEGLDYGCGPGPALAAMLREAGHRMEVFDPLFAPDRSVLERRYDFVTCTETVEHFHEPADELDRLGRLVGPGGILAIMTCFQTDDDRFAGWHYRLDPTHVVFYREATFRYLARMRGWACEVPTKDVVFMGMPAG